MKRCAWAGKIVKNMRFHAINEATAAGAPCKTAMRINWCRVADDEADDDDVPVDE